MIPVDEARRIVLDHVRVLGEEEVPFALAPGRVLRQPIVADRDFPPFDRAAMDGFAVRSLDAAREGVRLEVIGDIRAGVSPTFEVGTNQAARIMTGAPVPVGADAVIPVERTAARRDGKDSREFVTLEVAVASGLNIVSRGSESRAGDTLAGAGLRLDGALCAVIASVGGASVRVTLQPHVAVLVTGDEVVPVAAQPRPAQIRNANGPALRSAVEDAGGVAWESGIVADEHEATRAAIERAIQSRKDAIVLSGGVSAGDFDFVEGALATLGARVHITAVRIKPGAPFVFATLGDLPVFGLPGNPVSAQVTFELFVRPALLRMQNATRLMRPVFPAVLEGPLTNRSNRRNYLPVRVTSTSSGWSALPILTRGSGDLVAHARANGLAILEEDRLSASAGDTVLIHPLSSLLEA